MSGADEVADLRRHTQELSFLVGLGFEFGLKFEPNVNSD